MLTEILSCCIAGIHTSGCDSRRYLLDQVAAGAERCFSLHFAVYYYHRSYAHNSTSSLFDADIRRDWVFHPSSGIFEV